MFWENEATFEGGKLVVTQDQVLQAGAGPEAAA